MSELENPPKRACTDVCDCREPHENDAPDFYHDGRSRAEAQKAARTFVLLHPQPIRAFTIEEIIYTMNTFGYFFTEYDVNETTAIKMMYRVLADRAVLEAGDARARIASTVDALVGLELRKEITDALALMCHEDLHSKSNEDKLLSAMKRGDPTGLVDSKQQMCGLCGVNLMHSAAYQAHCCSKGHYEELTKQTVRCATCNWGAIGRGVHEHMTGKKHRKQMMAYFAERGWVTARGEAPRADASSSSMP
jgi:hypothetical protein